jgi:F0F1-type ATP synthase membrane subunit b/b'
MSELTNQVRRMLSQAQKFVTDAPLEAVSRAQLALRTARAALATAAAEERAELETLIELAETRIERDGQALSRWSGTVRARADLYNHNERKKLAEPLPPKV